jgi:hypothetical protein
LLEIIMGSLASGLVGGGLSLLGGVLGGRSAQRAAETSAQAQLEAARLAAESSRFRPVGITTRFGTSQFQMSPEGYLTGAQYTVSPELQAYQNRLMGLAGQGLETAEQAGQAYAPLTTAAQGLFGLGQQYLAQTPEQVAQQYIESQRSLLQPGREQTLSNIRNQLFQTGRGGLSVAQGGDLAASNPELQAYYNALAQQESQLAAGAQEAGQRQLAFGTGLFGTGADLMGQAVRGQVGALAPFQTNLGLTQTLEELGQGGLNLGSALGGNAATAGSNAGRALLAGGLSAAETMQAANAFNPLSYGLMGVGRNIQQYGLPTISSPTNMLNQSYYGTFGITPEQAPYAI